MRRLRSFVALFSAVAVMACQTAAAVGSTGMSAPLTSVAAAHSGDASIASGAVKSEAAAPAAASSSKRKTILIVAVLAAVIVAAVIISSGDGGSSIY